MIDPNWAWSPFEPSQESPWDRRAAAHLFRRAGFSANWQTISEAVVESANVVVDRLLDATEPAAFRSQIDAVVQSAIATGEAKQLSAAWIYRMIQTPAPMLEKTTLFWHGHFATSAEKVADVELMQTQNNLLRNHALGNFGQLALEISKDPAMLIYLDSVANRKLHPNENYAREIMELFCLGEGNYSETDVRELARCFTGWEVKRKQFRFNRYQHDRSEKTLLNRTGKFGGEDGVAMVTAQPSCPRFIASKLIRFFVMDEPAATRELVQPLADELRKNDLQLKPTIKRILNSQLFFSPLARAQKIRSPIEVAVGFLRSLDGSGDVFRLAGDCERLGQAVFYPPSVKGWDGGRTWINSSTLLGRANLIRRLLDSEKTRFGKQDLVTYLATQGLDKPSDLAGWMSELMFAVPLSDRARDQVAKLDNAPVANDQRMKDAVHILCSLPEFQLA